MKTTISTCFSILHSLRVYIGYYEKRAYNYAGSLRLWSPTRPTSAKRQYRGNETSVEYN